MIRISWRLVDVVSRLLDPDERDAVRGDLAESGVTGAKALLDLLGLVARRQAALWKDWRPWLVLLGIVVPLGVLLSRLSVSATAPLWMNLQSFRAYGVPFRNGLSIPEEIVVFVCHSLAIVLWSWTAGFVSRCLSPRAIWVNGALLCLVTWFSIGGRASLLALVAQAPQLILVLLPFVFGARKGRTLVLGTGQAVMLAAAIATMLVLATWTSGWRQAGIRAWSEGVWQGGPDWPRRLLPSAVASWPVAYLLATAIPRRWRKDEV